MTVHMTFGTPTALAPGGYGGWRSYIEDIDPPAEYEPVIGVIVYDSRFEMEVVRRDQKNQITSLNGMVLPGMARMVAWSPLGIFRDHIDTMVACMEILLDEKWHKGPEDAMHARLAELYQTALSQ